MNLLTETIEIILDNNQKFEDIIFIGSKFSGHSCNWDEFCLMADVEYDEEAPPQRVASNLIIVFRDGGKLLREESYGKEWWEYTEPFYKPEKLKKITRLISPEDSDGWMTLRDINK